MKKFYQIISTVALSALVMGANAQNANPGHFQHALPVHNLPAHNSGNNNTDRVQAGPTHVLLDYVNGDIVKDNTRTFYYWTPPLYSNVNYTLADTTFSPFTSAKANLYTAQYSSVAFDTCWDLYSQTMYNPVITGPSTVDTIWAQMAFHNTSAKNDTVDFEVVAVDANGFPSGTVYGTVKQVFAPSGSPLAYNKLDSVQTIAIPCNIVIPITARHKWNFAINFKVHASKQDTVGLWYYSAADICTNAFCSAYTTMGVLDGRAPAVNSLVTGNMWFNDVKNHGNATPIIFPNIPPRTASNFPGMCANTGGYYYYDQIGCTPDSSYFYVQDLALYASISFNMVVGMQQIANNGFEVGQNYPNPYNKTTQIVYNLTKESDVVFTVYDMAGRELVNHTYSTVAAGQHVVTLDAGQFTPGIYFYTFNVNGVKVTKRMVITE